MNDAKFDEYVRLYRRSVFAAALCLVRNPSDADDITQEAFLRLYRYGGSFNDGEHVKAWLIRCAVNRGKTLLGSRWHRFSEPLDVASDAVYNDSPETGDDLLSLLGKVSKNDRIALHMYYYEGYKTEEIAEILGISRNAVLSRLSRGRRRLKELISDERNEDNGLQKSVR